MNICRWLVVLAAGWCLMIRAQAVDTSSYNLQELLGIIRSNLTGVTEVELNRVAAEGIMSALYPRVTLVTNAPLSATDTSPARDPRPIEKVAVFDGQGYVRLGKVGIGLAPEFRKAVDSLSSTSKIKGLLLDLRFATGGELQAASAVAELFTGEGLARSREGRQGSREGGQLPVAILVNSQTTGAAEALAGMLRESKAGLIVGSATAGQAQGYREFTLSTGQRIRLAEPPPALATNEKPVSSSGLTPDLMTRANLEHERKWLDDPYLVIPETRMGAEQPNMSSSGRARRMNEAELVRRHREGMLVDEEPGRVPAPPAIQDPALARGLDFLKGLSTVKQMRALISR